MIQKQKNGARAKVVKQYKDEKSGAVVTVYAPNFPEVRHICQTKGTNIYTGTWWSPRDMVAIRAYIPPMF